ncbi:MAG: hypothetical protein QXO15_00535 [Nitrososphaerota archaeon]
MSKPPIGFDTVIYLVQAKQLSSTPSMLPFFSKILSILYLSGIDLMLLMKIIPVIVFTLIVFLSCLYAWRRLGWRRSEIIILCLVMSFSTAMLRASWDLHRQSLATLFLILYMNIDLFVYFSKRAFVTSFILVILVSLLHEIVLAVLSIMNIYLMLLSVKERSFKKTIAFLTLVSAPVMIYELAMYASYSKFALLTDIFEDLLSRFEPSGYQNVVSHAVGILVATFWYILPLSPLGFFHDRHLSPWLLLTLSAYLSEVLTPFMSIKMAERWMLYMMVPLAFYASNALRKLSTSLNRKVPVFIALTIISLNGFGMLGIIQPFRLPSELYIGFIPSTMVFSTSKPEHVEEVIEFTRVIKNLSWGNACIVTHDPWFSYWVQYLTDLKIYTFSKTGPDPAISEAETEECNEIYVIWFKGQVNGELISKGNELGLYRVQTVK